MVLFNQRTNFKRSFISPASSDPGSLQLAHQGSKIWIEEYFQAVDWQPAKLAIKLAQIVTGILWQLDRELVRRVAQWKIGQNQRWITVKAGDPFVNNRKLPGGGQRGRRLRPHTEQRGSKDGGNREQTRTKDKYSLCMIPVLSVS